MKSKENKVKMQAVPSAVQKKNGRTTKNNAALWSRRIREYRLWSMGVNKSEIAESFNITPKTVAEDLEAVAMLEPIEDMKRKIDANLKEVIRTCFEKVNADGIPENAKVGYIHEINEAVSRTARIHGLEKENNNFYLSQTINNLSGVENKYADWNSDRLQEEFGRRRLSIKP